MKRTFTNFLKQRMNPQPEAQKERMDNDEPQDREEYFEQADDSSDQVAELKDSLREAKDQVMRRTAELDNMRRRHQQERETLIIEGNRRLISDLLGTVDDLERTLEHASDEKDPMRQGVELVYKNFLKILERYGVSAMDVVGKPFDPHKHDALMEEPSSTVAPGTVTREIQKGYMMGDSVLRHAKVMVSKAVE